MRVTINLSLRELVPPQLQFGGPATSSDPKVGLRLAGPFDLRFGAARQTQVKVGIIGPGEMVDQTRRWIARCRSPIPVLGTASLLQKPFPGFAETFRMDLVDADGWCVRLDSSSHDAVAEALAEPDAFRRFQKIVDLYSDAHARLASRDANRPDVIILALPEEVLKKARMVERGATEEEKKKAKEIAKSRASRQMDMFDMLQDVEQTEEDFLKRDLRHALKARAMANKLPIQIATTRLLEDGEGEDPATRAWNFAVGLYYKAGNVPWRLPTDGPETCFVGVSFHHFRTTQRHIVQSTLAQAFSSEGEGFAIRGQGVPAEEGQGRNVHLSHEQALNLGRDVLAEYARRTGGAPIRLVIHKTTYFDDSERAGFTEALRDIPIMEMVTLVPSAFRLLRFGSYPPKVGTLCSVNDARHYLFTSGYMPELGTYPGPHVPQPFEVRHFGDGDHLSAAQDVFNLTRMNWNTADIRGKWPVTLSFARRVGGILDEYEEFGSSDQDPATSLRYFV
ncbi:MAG TPA: hypothetical protein VJS85_07385 [Rhizomicrobium sp.]|nr:hypothetical protein [Rhizomicrobium sp.]